MDLEKEIVLLKEKVALLEKVRDLQEMVRKAEADKVYVSYPVYPVWLYQEPGRITYGTYTHNILPILPNVTNDVHLNTWIS